MFSIPHHRQSIAAAAGHAHRRVARAVLSQDVRPLPPLCPPSRAGPRRTSSIARSRVKPRQPEQPLTRPELLRSRAGCDAHAPAAPPPPQPQLQEKAAVSLAVGASSSPPPRSMGARVRTWRRSARCRRNDTRSLGQERRPAMPAPARAHVHAEDGRGVGSAAVLHEGNF